MGDVVAADRAIRAALKEFERRMFARYMEFLAEHGHLPLPSQRKDD